MKTLRESKNERISRFYDRMHELGLSFSEIETLRKAQLTLHRWAELECGDGNDYASWSIERDEETGKPYKCVYPHSGPSRRYPIADREKGALRRIAAIIGNHPNLWFYHQTDPRGCALYVGVKPTLEGGPNGTGLLEYAAVRREALNRYLEQNYNRGIAVCI